MAAANGGSADPKLARDQQAYGDGKPKKALSIVCFSDIDGTIVHYPEVQDKWGQVTVASVLPSCFLWVEKENGRRHKLLKLPPSSTGLQGWISVKTLMDFAHLRVGGTKLVLITGARLSTLLQRLPFLPAADAFVCENGGRIFYPDATLPTAFPVAEDLRWRNRHNDTGEGVPCMERRGKLWDFYRKLVSDGWAIDTMYYTTSFRLKVQGGKTDDDLAKVLASLPEGLHTSFNYHMADVFPATSGKGEAAAYLIRHFDASPDRALLLCDDDNDLALAKLVAKVYVPNATSQSVADAVARQPEKFVLAKRGGTLGTEEMLEKVEDYLGTFVLG